MSAAERAIARCKVVLCVEVTPSDRWGDDCPISQVRKQGASAAENIVRRMIEAKVGGGSVRLLRMDAINVITFDRASEDKTNE